MTHEQQQTLEHFRTERYHILNRIRWEALEAMAVPFKDKVIFEAGAGIGDQTEWLLNKGAEFIYVNDGRRGNLEMIKERLPNDPRLSFVLADLETLPACCVVGPDIDLVYMLGVYYHIHDDLEKHQVLETVSRLGETAIIEYLESSKDEVSFYGYENPSTSLSQYGTRPTKETMVKAMERFFDYVYWPKRQLDWHDPASPDQPRRLIVGSHVPLLDWNVVPA